MTAPQVKPSRAQLASPIGVPCVAANYTAKRPLISHYHADADVDNTTAG